MDTNLDHDIINTQQQHVAGPADNPIMPRYQNIQDMLLSEIRSIEGVIKENILTEPKRTYPLDRFTSYFAPFFLGVWEAPKNIDVQMLWISEVGNQHTEITVVDETGKEVFVVPPLMNSGALSIKNNTFSRIRFNGLENQLNADKMNNPQGAHVEYFNSVGEKLSTLFENYSIDPTYKDKWRKIYEFYSVPIPGEEQKSQPSGTPSFPTTTGGVWANAQEPDFG